MKETVVSISPTNIITVGIMFVIFSMVIGLGMKIYASVKGE